MSLDKILKDYEKRREPVPLVLIQVSKRGCDSFLVGDVSVLESIGIPAWTRHLPQGH